jgi:integrase/recombinase XerC
VEWANAFASSLRASGKAQKTVDVYQRSVRSYCEVVDPIQAKPVDIETWLTQLGVGANTIGQYLIRLRQFHKWLIREGYRLDNPVDLIDAPKVAPKKPRPLPEQYLHAIWDIADKQERAWIVLGLYCGLRASEAVSVRVEDIVDGPSLRIVGKGGRERVVPMRPEVLEALRDLWPGTGRFFPKANEKTASVRIGKLLRQVGCPPLYSFHSLRHSFGSATYKASRDIRLVQELLGHASLTTTQGYVAFDDEQARWVVSRLPALVA